MKYLIDTHVILWFVNNEPKKLGGRVISILEDVSKPVFFSIVSLWEFSIKHSMGRLELDESLEDFFDHILESKFELLPISTEDLIVLNKLPLHHQDPFDRLIISQALNYGLQHITKDRMFNKYDVQLLWN